MKLSVTKRRSGSRQGYPHATEIGQIRANPRGFAVIRVLLSLRDERDLRLR